MPGRFSFPVARERLRVGEAAAGAVLLAVAAVVTRLPFRTRYLANWDADQFALGMRHFDLAHHQPHPPGYIGYIALGRLLEPLFGDANATLVAVSVGAEAAAVVAGFLFARALFGRLAGWVTGLALLTAPLFWFYGEVANTYGLEPLLVLGIAWPCWKLWRGEPRFANPAALALGLAGALRPSTMVLLLPLFGIALLRSGAPWPLALRSLAVLAAAVAAWAVPLLVLAGGPVELLRLSLQLGDSVTTGTAAWNNPAHPLLVTLPAVVAGTGWVLGAFSIPAVFGLLFAPRLLRRRVLSEEWSLFCWVWAGPALLVFTYIHIGQVVYVQVFAPALLLSLGPALAATSAALGRPLWTAALAAACALGSVLVFMGPGGLASQLQSHDRRVEGMLSLAAGLEPSRTVLIGDAEGVGSYRTVSYYLPGYPRLGIGFDARGRLRELFGDEYDPIGVRESRPIAFPAGATDYIFLDRQLLPHLADPGRLRRVSMPDGSAVYVWHGPPPVVIANHLWIDREHQAGAGAISY